MGAITVHGRGPVCHRGPCRSRSYDYNNSIGRALTATCESCGSKEFFEFAVAEGENEFPDTEKDATFRHFQARDNGTTKRVL